MKVLIDGDGCPVIHLAVTIATSYNLKVIVVCDSTHHYQLERIKLITVDKGKDATDFELLKYVEKGDIVITQDYGLAAMVLTKQAYVMNQNGMQYTSNNIDQLLFSRHLAQKVRKAGGRLKGPSKRKTEDDLHFEQSFSGLIHRLLESK